MRELRHEAQGRAGAALPRSGDRIPLAFRREHAEFHGGPLRPEADHVAILQHHVARDPLAIDEGPVFEPRSRRLNAAPCRTMAAWREDTSRSRSVSKRT